MPRKKAAAKKRTSTRKVRADKGQPRGPRKKTPIPKKAKEAYAKAKPKKSTRPITCSGLDPGCAKLGNRCKFCCDWTCQTHQKRNTENHLMCARCFAYPDDRQVRNEDEAWKKYLR